MKKQMKDKTVCVVGLGYAGMLRRRKRFRKGSFFLLAQVFFCKKKKCVDVRGMFDGEEAKRKGFYYKTL